MSNAIDRFVQLRAYMMRISPFFSTLLLHTTVELSDSVPTMAVTNRQPHPRHTPANQLAGARSGANPTTGGTTSSGATASPTTSSTAPGTTASTAAAGTTSATRSVILINQEFADTLSDSEFMAVVCHEVLHLAFCHLNRAPAITPAAGGSQVHMYYLNLAADIIVNGIIVESGLFKLPEGAMTETTYAELVGSCSSTDVLQGGTRGLRLWSLPKVYQRVCADAPPVVEVNMCLAADGSSADGSSADGSSADGSAAEAWEEILATAKTAELMAGKSSRYLRDLAELEANSEVTDYRSLLAKFVFQSPETFDDSYDRRFIHQGLYMDVPMSDTLDLEILIDSSGSIDTDLLKTFLSELSSNLLLSRWAAIRVTTWFFDTALYAGPASIDEICALKTIPGGGGTDFACWHELARNSTYVLGGGGSKVVLVYTDGYAMNIYDADFYSDVLGTTNILWVFPAREETNKRMISLASDMGHQYLHLT